MKRTKFNKPAQSKPTHIRIVCHVSKSPEFANCKVGSVHEIISAPKGLSKELAEYGQWIMDVDRPVKIFPLEFEYVKNEEK